MENSTKYRKIFNDICQGYSVFDFNQEKLYLRHLSIKDHVDFEVIYNDNLKEILAKGCPSQAERLALLKEEGDWTDKDEKDIAVQNSYITNLIITKKNLVMKRQIEDMNKQIKEGEAKLQNLRNRKQTLLGVTAENRAEQIVNEFYVIKCLYADETLKTPKFTEGSYSNVESEVVSTIIKQYNTIYSNFSDREIQVLALQEFYSVYFSLCDNSLVFFGKPVMDLTQNQVRLLVYTKYYKNVFENYPKIPEDVIKDPDKINDYIAAQQKAQKTNQTTSDNDSKPGFYSRPGMNKSEYDYAGFEGRPVSLANEAKKHGGSLDLMQMADFLAKNG
jgi:hypothetical protein